MGERTRVMQNCDWEPIEWIQYSNYLIFSLSITFMMAVLVIICHVQHGNQRINSITLRPWRVALLSLISIAAQTLSNEPHFLLWSVWFSIERVNKLFNVYFVMTLVNEKDILSLFMSYQIHFDLRQHDVMKDKFKEVERKHSNLYWRNVLALLIFVSITILLTLGIPDKNPGYMEIKISVNLLILGIQAIYLRLYVTKTTTFLNLMENHFHYEY